MADKSLPLRDLKSVNTALSLLYDKDGNYRLGFSPDGFYKTQLLNTLEWGTENHVHQMFATTEVLKPGQKAVKYRRYRSLTPNLAPLPEGLPNQPDKLAYEEIEISNLFTFGRWYEFTAEVDWDVVDPIIARATQNLVDVAARTKELYARKTWLSSPNQYFAGGKTFDTLTLADAITLEDLLFIVSRMERMQVNPIGGKFNYICSKEFLRGLIKDPIVDQYLGLNQVSPGEFLKALNGEPLDLIDIKFIPTMLDEYAYPDIEYPGVYYNATLGKEVIRYVYDATTGINYKTKDGLINLKSGTIYYLDVPEDFVVDIVNNVPIKVTKSGVTYLNDGSAIDNKTTWHLPLTAGMLSNQVGVKQNVSATLEAGKARLLKAEVSGGTHGVLTAATITWDATGNGSNHADVIAFNDAIENGKFTQLPVHRGILFGDEALVKIVHANRNDAAELIIHKPGEAGALDPYNQRQSIAVRVKGFGVGINRTEAIAITFGVPFLAANAFLTAQYMEGKARMLDERESGKLNDVSATTGYQTLPVPGINMAALPYDMYPKYKTGVTYTVGTVVAYDNSFYVFHTQLADSANNGWAAAKSKVVKIAQPYTDWQKLPDLKDKNDPTSNER